MFKHSINVPSNVATKAATSIKKMEHFLIQIISLGCHMCEQNTCTHVWDAYMLCMRGADIHSCRLLKANFHACMDKDALLKCSLAQKPNAKASCVVTAKTRA